MVFVPVVDAPFVSSLENTASKVLAAAQMLNHGIFGALQTQSVDEPDDDDMCALLAQLAPSDRMHWNASWAAFPIECAWANF